MARTFAVMTLAFAIGCIPLKVRSQELPKTDNLSGIPSDVYQSILDPFEAVRADIQNWSPVEREAYQVASQKAEAACSTLERQAFEGEQLLALARICALGEKWPSVYSAAIRYARNEHANSPTDAYGLAAIALIKQGNTLLLLQTLQDLSKHGAYTPAMDAIFSEAIRETRLSDSLIAIKIGAIRAPLLMEQLKTGATNHLDATVARQYANELIDLYMLRKEFNLSSEADGDINSELASIVQRLHDPKVEYAWTRYSRLGSPLGLSITPAPKHSENDRKAAVYFVIPLTCTTCPLIHSPDTLRGLAKSRRGRLIISGRGRESLVTLFGGVPLNGVVQASDRWITEMGIDQPFAIVVTADEKIEAIEPITQSFANTPELFDRFIMALPSSNQQKKPHV